MDRLPDNFEALKALMALPPDEQLPPGKGGLYRELGLKDSDETIFGDPGNSIERQQKLPNNIHSGFRNGHQVKVHERLPIHPALSRWGLSRSMHASSRVLARVEPFELKSQRGSLIQLSGDPLPESLLAELNQSWTWKQRRVSGDHSGVTVTRKVGLFGRGVVTVGGITHAWLYDLWLAERLVKALATAS